MHDISSTMALLQFGDSFFPSGSVSFSWGLEALAETGAVTGAGSVQAFVIGQLHCRWAHFDRAIIVAAHRASRDLELLAAIDNLVEILTASSELRSGSRRMGEAMLSVFARFGIDDVPSYRDRITCGAACGHLAVVQGFLWARVGLGEADSIALSAHTFCVGLLGAGIRLGCLTHIDAQRILFAAREEAISIASMPPPPIGEISSFGVEAEIAVMRHAHHATRMFAN